MPNADSIGESKRIYGIINRLSESALFALRRDLGPAMPRGEYWPCFLRDWLRSQYERGEIRGYQIEARLGFQEMRGALRFRVTQAGDDGSNAFSEESLFDAIGLAKRINESTGAKVWISETRCVGYIEGWN